MKRVLACICGWILLCGIQLTVWGHSPLTFDIYTVQQPSGETFNVLLYDDNRDLHVNSYGTVWINKDKNIYYVVVLAEDGYWYYSRYDEIRCVLKKNHEITKIIQDEKEWIEFTMSEEFSKYTIENVYLNKAKYLIDDLPDVVQSYGIEELRETTQEEKETMAEMIAAERRRLRKEELTTTGEEPVESVISDPGPELFITVPVEGTESQPAAVTEQPAEATSEPAQTEHTEETETQSAPETTTAGEPSEPAVTAVAEEENTGRWTGPLLWGGGILVLIGLGAGGGILLWRRKKKRGA